jgi:hypothetical protein
VQDQEVVKGMDQTVIMQLKSDLCLHHHYVQDPFTPKQICKPVDIATAGENLIKVINSCATYEGRLLEIHYKKKEIMKVHWKKS